MLEPYKKRKRGILYIQYIKKKTWGMLDIKPQSAAAMNANKDIKFYFPKGKLKLFHSLN